MSFYPCLLNPWTELKEQHLSAGATASLNRSPCLLLCSFQSSSLLKISFQPKKGNEKPNLWFHPAKQCTQIKVRSLMCPDWQFFATQSHDAELRVLLYFYLPLQTRGDYTPKQLGQAELQLPSLLVTPAGNKHTNCQHNREKGRWAAGFISAACFCSEAARHHLSCTNAASPQAARGTRPSMGSVLIK